MTIKWGRTIEIEFDGPISMEEWTPPRCATIYAIMIKPDSRNRPNTFRIIYFGESENLSERGFYNSHHKYSCWHENASEINSDIFIGIYRMPNSTEERRKEIERSLINDYNPVCND